MTFGQALDALKSGNKVRRAGWNGKGMWLCLIPGSRFEVVAGRPLAAHIAPGTTVDYEPHIDMWSAQGRLFAWNPNCLDLLAEDWEVA